ncbi:unnamed protein product [Adineta steineri]|uniref:Uncharacterized protein n=1 Tax=Adineta steineri TaxID=433720 RepID=A0A819FZA9_9BILA|nr:unnamed protein product [Adineta steineri]CAF3871681.1 unnamed protein product [Adineta steineri]
MDDNEFQQFLTLFGESFYQHIEKVYGKFIEKILRYHDIDNYVVLGETDKHEILDILEKPNDTNTSEELINLKKEVCHIIQEITSLKIGTKNKLISLLKLAQDVVNKKKLLLMSQTRLNRLNKSRSTSSSSNSNTSDTEINLKKYSTFINESISKLLTSIKNNIHGFTNTNITAKDFKVMIEHINDRSEPICNIHCVCGDRIKLYLRNDRFQLSNLQKHFKIINNKVPILINNNNQQTDDLQDSDQIDIDNPVSRNESSPSTTQSTLREYTNIDSDATDGMTSTTVKQSYSQNQLHVESNTNKRSTLSLKTTKIQQNGQPVSRNLPKPGETQSSITIMPPSKSKKQLLNNETTQTTNSSSSTLQHSKSVKEQNANLNQVHQQKKRKLIENDNETEFSSTVKNNRRNIMPTISFDKINNTDILCSLLKTIDLNSHRSPNNFRYCDSVLRFATCLFIVAGIYAYEYIRINLKFLLPSIQTIKNIYNRNPYLEAKFRYEESKTYLESIQCNYIFLSEDCSAIIPRIEYDSYSNTFNGFVTPIIDGIPLENYFSCKTYDELKLLFETTSRANLVNVHLMQPICSKYYNVIPSASVLAAYGTDNKLTSMDILKRWLMMYQQFYSRNIRVVGFSTDGDPKYLRAMRLSSNFFVKTQTLNVSNDKLSFTINIPDNWSSWFFLNSTQLLLYMQDGIHLCTKTRNRLLSKKTQLKMGLYEGSIQHLQQLIKTTNKIDHNLSNSDLNVHDKQNFSSCQRISDDKVLNLLFLYDKYKATYNYLLMLNLMITAYTLPNISLLDRIYYAWIILFYVRLWRIWLYVTKKNSKSSIRKSKTKEKKNNFITSNALISIEMNAHYLIYLYLLIEEKILPQSASKSIHLFSSQACENIFRDTRSLSGTYSTRINFTIKQFLNRIDKLNALTELKQFELNNTDQKIIFPIHHKIKRHIILPEHNNNNDEIDYNLVNIEEVIFDAYNVAQQMATSVGMNIHLVKKNLFNIEESSQMAKKLLNWNSLSEEEILIIDECDDQDTTDKNDDDEDDADVNCEYEEDDMEEEEDVDEDGVTEDVVDEDRDDEDGADEDRIDEDGVDEDNIDEDNVDEESAAEDSVDEDSTEETSTNISDCSSFEDDIASTVDFKNIQATSFSASIFANLQLKASDMETIGLSGTSVLWILGRPYTLPG